MKPYVLTTGGLFGLITLGPCVADGPREAPRDGALVHPDHARRDDSDSPGLAPGLTPERPVISTIDNIAPLLAIGRFEPEARLRI